SRGRGTRTSRSGRRSGRPTRCAPIGASARSGRFPAIRDRRYSKYLSRHKKHRCIEKTKAAARMRRLLSPGPRSDFEVLSRLAAAVADDFVADGLALVEGAQSGALDG